MDSGNSEKGNVEGCARQRNRLSSRFETTHFTECRLGRVTFECFESPSRKCVYFPRISSGARRATRCSYGHCCLSRQATIQIVTQRQRHISILDRADPLAS